MCAHTSRGWTTGGSDGIRNRWAAGGGGVLRAVSVQVQAERPVLEFGRRRSAAVSGSLLACLCVPRADRRNERWPLLFPHTTPHDVPKN